MSKLDQYLAELEGNTSGGSHDAVIFAGKGIELLKSLTKKAPKDAEDTGRDEDDDQDDDEDDDEGEGGTMKKNREANGGDYDEEDEDPEDPADANGDSIISNKGRRQSKSSLSRAVSKNFRQEENRFAKSVGGMYEDHAEFMDVTPAFEDLTASVGLLGKSVHSHGSVLSDLATTQQTLLKNFEVVGAAMRELLKSQASIAADLEEVKKQPVGSPALGLSFTSMQKNAAGAGGAKPRVLMKSDMEDVLTDALNNGEIDHMTLAKSAVLRTQAELDSFVADLPSVVRERLNA